MRTSNSNFQSFELTIIPVEIAEHQYLALHIPNTGFLEPLDEPALNVYRDCWQQIWVSESTAVYRSEYLAARLLFSQPFSSFGDHSQISQQVQQYISQHSVEGYEEGVHDLDASAILTHILTIYPLVGLLRFAATSRSLAQLFWAFYPHQAQQKIWLNQVAMLTLLPLQLSTVNNQPGEWAQANLVKDLTAAVRHFLQIHQLSDTFSNAMIAMAGEYLLEELKSSPVTFTVTASAMQLVTDFEKYLQQQGQQVYCVNRLGELKLSQQWLLVTTWLTAYANQFAPDHCQEVLEATTIFLTQKILSHQPNSAPLSVKVTQLVGQHPRIHAQTLTFQLDEFFARLRHFQQQHVPLFEQFCQAREQFKQQFQADLPDFSPPASPHFFCNRLIEQIYLPRVLKNLQTQLAMPNADGNRQSRGLLLLSSPGYGKTEFVQYIAAHLGVIMIRINGRLLEAVDCLDPTVAPNALSRYEVEKINFALAIGYPVMLFVDQIEEMAPRLLQDLASLVQRRTMTGVWRGKVRDYQLNQPGFCLVMAGNFSNASGEWVCLPTTLTEVTEIYDLNEIINDKGEGEALRTLNLQALEESEKHSASNALPLFALSYLENALFCHPLLADLMKQADDIYQFIALTYGESISSQALSGDYSAHEINQITAIIEKLLQIQAVVFTVNQHALTALTQARQSGAPLQFQLTGNYRQMNHLASQITLAMTTQEVEQLIDAYYFAQAYTLPATVVEKNLLKFLAIQGKMTPTQQQRWQQIQSNFNPLATDDGVAAMVAHLSKPIERIDKMLDAIHQLLEKLPALMSQVEISVSVKEAEMITGLINPLENLEKTLYLIYQLLETIAQQDIKVVNQPSTEFAKILQQLVEMIETTLLPIVQDFERKSKLDLMIFGRVKELAEQFKLLQQESLQAKENIKRYKPLSFKREE